MNFSRVQILPACLLLAICAAGCGTESSFFRVRNPFDVEAKAIANFNAQSGPENSAPLSGNGFKPRDYPEPEVTRLRESPYFGQGNRQKSNASLFSKKVEPRDAGTAETDPVHHPLPSNSIDRRESPASPHATAAGEVCYRCNGKGFYLTSLALDAQMQECAQCGGAGRR